LAAKIVARQNFSTSTTVDDIAGHGTHCAGIAAAITNNTAGIAGVGYNVSLMSVKVLGDNGSGYTSAIAQGIIWAVDNGANVISMSLGGGGGTTTFQEAIDYAWNKGVVVVAAAGNSGTSAPSYPAYYTNCIAVAASDQNDRLYSFSNYGSWVDVAAPGSAYSTLPDNRYGMMSGTSMATPFVSGLAGLAFSIATDTNGNGKVNDEVRALIENNTDNVGITNIMRGRINAYKTVSGSTSTPTTGQISGTVKDITTGLAISGATVSDGVRSAITTSTGAYTLTNVPAGSYALTANAATYQTGSASVIVIAGQTSTANFSLTKAPTDSTMWVDSITFTPSSPYLNIKVKVVNPQPIAGAQVNLRVQVYGYPVSATKATDINGEVTFRLSPVYTGATYTAAVTTLTLSGYTWDTAKGVSSVSYTVPSGTPTPTPTPLPTDDEIQSQAFNLINNARVNAGLTPLIQDPNLTALAKEHTEDMITENRLSHDGFEDRAARSGYSYVGENVAMGVQTAQALVDAWLSSPGHRANIMNPAYRYSGLSYMNGWATQMFGG
jgi:thermitase